jgi:hypothetical protein
VRPPRNHPAGLFLMDKQIDKLPCQDDFEIWAKKFGLNMGLDYNEGGYFYCSNVTNAAYCAFVAARSMRDPNPDATPAPMLDPTELTAFNFGTPYPGNDTGESDLTFGLSNENTALQLRNFAAWVEAGLVYLQSVRVRSIQKLNDFPMSLLSIVYAPTRPKK